MSAAMSQSGVAFDECRAAGDPISFRFNYTRLQGSYMTSFPSKDCLNFALGISRNRVSVNSADISRSHRKARGAQ
jgi:hypothetical protein